MQTRVKRVSQREQKCFVSKEDNSVKWSRRDSTSSVTGVVVTRTMCSFSRLLPRVKLGKYVVSRLIISENTFYGHFDFNLLLSRLMSEWCTPERVCEIVRRCEAEGGNSWESTHRRVKLADFERHREDGGAMQFILLGSREMGKIMI